MALLRLIKPSVFIFLFMLYPLNISLAEKLNRDNHLDKTIFLKENEKKPFQLNIKKNIYILTPVLKTYSNIKGLVINDQVCSKFIEYTSTYVGEFRKFHYPSSQVGTYYLYFSKKKDETIKLKSQGPIHIENKDIFQIVVRKDDSYIGFLTELMKTPVMIYPKTVTDNLHQTELRIASDCVPFVIYGLRKLNRNVAYHNMFNIKRILKRKEVGDISIGDILLFKDHIGVFYKDVNNNNKADPEDQMIHSLLDTPKIDVIGENNGPFLVCEFDIQNI